MAKQTSVQVLILTLIVMTLNVESLKAIVMVWDITIVMNVSGVVMSPLTKSTRTSCVIRTIKRNGRRSKPLLLIPAKR